MTTKYFTVPTKFGTMFAVINGAKSIHLTNRKTENYKQIAEEIKIGNYSINPSGQFSLNNGQFDGQAYAFDGNTLRFVAGEDTFKSRCLYWGFEEPTARQKIKVYDEFLRALNEVYLKNKSEWDAEFRAKVTADKQSEINELNEKIEKLTAELAAAKNELKKINDEILY